MVTGEFTKEAPFLSFYSLCSLNNNECQRQNHTTIVKHPFKIFNLNQQFNDYDDDDDNDDDIGRNAMAMQKFETHLHSQKQ